jgi:glycosyltransferase involved in cell wall biosynthesis
MTEAMRGLLASPLADRYQQEMVATHRGAGPLRRLGVYGLALLRLTWWSLGGRGRIVHIHGTVRGSMYRKAVCVLLARALRRRVVFHVHSGPGDVATFRGGLGAASVAFFGRAFRAADVVVAVSSASARALEEAFGASGIVVVPNAAPPVEPEADRREPPAQALFLGGFANPVKGGEVLLEALTSPGASCVRVVLAGPGELPPAGRRLVEAGEGIEWRGWLAPAERDALLAEAGIFVLPSTSEGLPMALLEAISRGMAVVATGVGGVPDVVEDGESALVVPPGDPEALANALGRLAADPELRTRLGRAARARAAELGPDRLAERIDVLYRSLL